MVNTIIKSGTNNWHGDVYDYFRNRVLDANSFQNNFAGLGEGPAQPEPIRRRDGRAASAKTKTSSSAAMKAGRKWCPFPLQAPPFPWISATARGFANHGITVYDPLTTHACGGAGEPCSQSHILAQRFPRRRDSRQPHQPGWPEDSFLHAGRNSPGQGAGGISEQFRGEPERGPLLVQPGDRAAGTTSSARRTG